jgi:hypothetical protein
VQPLARKVSENYQFGLYYTVMHYSDYFARFRLDNRFDSELYQHRPWLYSYPPIPK